LISYIRAYNIPYAHTSGRQPFVWTLLRGGEASPRIDWDVTKDTMYPSVGARNTKSCGTQQASSFAAAMNPYFTSFCRWPGVTVEGVQSCSAMTKGGREGNTFMVLVFLLFPSFSLSLLFPPLFLFLDAGKEVGREWQMV
jgi:hypothetical protein